MPHYLSQDELQRTAPAETAAFASPVPTQIVSNGEFNPLPQSREQELVPRRLIADAPGVEADHAEVPALDRGLLR